MRSTGGPEVTTIDATGLSASVVTCASGEGADTVLDGFTITGGTGTGPGTDYSYGGGMYNSSSSPTVTNCTFTGNTASSYGGGMYNNYSSPTVTNCTFSGNTAAQRGGGMYNSSSSPTVTNCTFTGNTASSYGGGMYNYSNSSPTVTNCTFTDNTAAWSGGGMFNITNSSPTVTNCTFSGNRGDDDGGGMSNFWYCSPTVTNCTFSGNSAGYGGGGMDNFEFSYPTVTNCIFWGDTAPNDPEISKDPTSTAAVTYSDVEGGYTGTGNIDDDPLLTAYGVHLTLDSPCRDSGDPGGDYTGQTDIDGEARVIGGQVDMGADEWLDTDGDGLPDFWEQLHFGSPTAGDAGGDEDGDGVVNLDEYRLGRDPYLAPVHLYVDLTGDDAWDGLAAEWDGEHGPKATIQGAIDAAARYEGDQANVAPGTYDEAIDFLGKAITVRSTGGPEVTTIDATGLSASAVSCATGEGADTVLDGFTITGGSATYGGGMYNQGASPTVTNCTFTRNTATSYGGGMYNYNYSSPTVTNCTFTGNSASYGGGIFNGAGSPTVTNCILWGNAPDEIYNYSGTTTVTYSDVQDDDPDDGLVYPGAGNIDDDPLLTAHGVHLTLDSPCRDSGDPGGDYTGQTDMDGEARVIGGQVDMGADEWLDTDGDGLPDFWEQLHFGSPSAGGAGGDEDGDGVVNLDEYRLGRDPHRAPVQLYVDVSGDDTWDGLAAQ